MIKIYSMIWMTAGQDQEHWIAALGHLRKYQLLCFQ